jgi:hypothetical protein
MQIKELKDKWGKEKNSYAVKEVGSGVQKFVKDVLKSEEIFNLKEGLISTPLEKRHHEFTEESKTKASRQADIIIYINSDIIIPVEVEKFGNIKAGLDQLMQYQLDLDKKYGILTDGNTWQFYNNAYLLQQFNLEQIFNNPKLFNEFWQEYIKPENYYLSFFEEKGQLKIIPEDISVDKKRQDFFIDITTLIRSFKNKLQIEGYLKETDNKQKEQRAVEITYAYIIQFILYKTLVDNDFDDFKKEFLDIQNSIYECLKVKQYGKILGIIDGISNEISKNIYRPFAKEQEFITDKLRELLHKPKNELHDVSSWLDIFVFIKKYNFANVRNEIFGYIYENYLKELYEETQKGQYFTDPNVVDFMLKQIGYAPAEIKKRLDNKPAEKYISIIDPSCGSGTFLYSAVNQIINSVPNGSEKSSEKIEGLVNENVFGLDIAEFPLYLAEMNILMRMLPLIINEKYNNPIDKKIKVFKTNDSIAEFKNTALDNTIHNLEALRVRGGQLSMGLVVKALDLGYKSYVREESDLEEMKKSLEELPEMPRRRFDYVIGNPPYVGYNECSKQGVKIFELMKKGEASLNNIYGVNLHSIPNNQKKYAPKPNLYVFFIALGIALLKDNGKLCFIIPQTILTAGDLDVIRYHLAKFTTIEKIITFSGKMFIGRGLKQDKPVATSSLIFVIRRKVPELNRVEIINYKDPNDNIEETLQNILAEEKITKKEILQAKLLQSVANWNFIKHNKQFLDFYETYQRNTQDISIYYDHISAEQKFGNKFYFDGSFNIPTQDIQPQKIDGDYWEIPFLKSTGFKVKTKGVYPKSKKIKIAQGSQGMIMLNTNHKVIWRYVNPDKFFYIEGKNVFPRFQQFCIASNEKREILYLLSLLNSKIISLVLDKLLRNEQEKDILIGLSVIKEFVRVPKITETNQKIKKEIINQTENLLSLEEKTLSDFIDFSKVMVQKFSGVSVEGGNLILKQDKDKIKIPIRGDKILIKKIIDVRYNKKLKLENPLISLSELKALPIIDYEKQRELKNYIDDLVFALYFNIKLESLGLNKAEKIKTECLKNPYYKLIHSQK